MQLTFISVVWGVKKNRWGMGDDYVDYTRSCLDLFILVHRAFNGVLAKQQIGLFVYPSPPPPIPLT